MQAVPVVTPAALSCIENEILTNLPSNSISHNMRSLLQILAKLLHLSAAPTDLDAAQNIALKKYPCCFRLAAKCGDVPFDCVLLHLEHTYSRTLCVGFTAQAGGKEGDDEEVSSYV
jgi:hypothetical protein